MATKQTEPKLDPVLLKLMQDIYSKYTGQQVADVIAYIRACIEREREAEFIEQEIERLTAKLQTLSK